jgi:hypothetical protein
MLACGWQEINITGMFAQQQMACTSNFNKSDGETFTPISFMFVVIQTYYFNTLP